MSFTLVSAFFAHFFIPLLRDIDLYSKRLENPYTLTNACDFHVLLKSAIYRIYDFIYY